MAAPLPRTTPTAPRGAADVDVVVIGGGVNGTGVARDASMRGLKVALFERNDLAFGASGNSSGMIHGGPRYLTYDPDVTYTSCLDEKKTAFAVFFGRGKSTKAMKPPALPATLFVMR